jgi:glycosyltransferase involved in cell wall biosynthesis
MHIAIDARIINSSTGRYVERLLTYLQDIDSPHTFSVLVRTADKDYWKPTKSNFAVVIADYPQYTFREQLGFYFFLKKLGPDLVHFCMPQQPLLYTGKSVTTVHDLNLLHITENDGMSPVVLKTKKFIFKSLLNIVLDRSAAIITPTNFIKQNILSFRSIDENKIAVTYESADLVSKKPVVVKQYASVPFLLMVGRAEQYKNQKGAIEAHQQLLWKHPDLRLVIVGKRDDTSRQTEQWALTQGYRNVDFFGFASDEQLAWMYEQCQAYVFPSFMEGFGLPGLEAMRHSAPVISSNATCLPEVYGNAALYFDPANPREMADQIAKVLSDKKLRTDLIKKGTRQVKKYSWKRMATQTHQIYTEALS